MSCETYPFDARAKSQYKSNPAIQLFGNRLFIDQSPPELLSELLLILISEKRIGSDVVSEKFPRTELLKNWTNAPLEYSPKARLNIKLFSFLGASRLGSRHITHLQHLQQLFKTVVSEINTPSSANAEDVVRTLENLFLGFQCSGSGRAWCAQTFLPVSPALLACESIWKQSRARSKKPKTWEELLETESEYFDMSQHLFFARGGEVLYLQICNALRQPSETIRQWVAQNEISITSEEQNPEWLRDELEHELNHLMARCPSTLTEIAEFIDSGVERDTSQSTDYPDGKQRWATAGWCSLESWQEGYLFAVELLRLCKADLDLIDRLYLLETACSMQVLRTLAMQSSRHVSPEFNVGWPGYRMAISAPDDKRPAIKRLSQHTVRVIEKQIFQSIRSDEIMLPQGEKEPDKSLKLADRRYAGKLFIGLAKRIGLIVPRRGRGARFVLNERLLRFLVMTTVPIGGRITLDTFKTIVEHRHGIVFDAQGLNRANTWMEGTEVFLSSDSDIWLQNMLEASGLLIHLSDSCALIENPAESSN